MPNSIDKLAWICIQDKKALCVRSKNRSLFYSPGGKRDPGETDHQALTREILEELSVNLIPQSIRYANTFIAQADDKDCGVNVKLTCYLAGFTGVLRESAEIEEMKWVNYKDSNQCSLACKLVLQWLKKLQLID